jgi:LmbE family N-acetylglucosaminyl deacetylase
MPRRLTAGLALLAAAVALGHCGPRRPPGLTPLALPAEPRVLVFSPHPDDETLAVGGLLFDLARGGVPVRVVFLTSGDGYLEAAQARFQEAEPGSAAYLALGRLREAEAQAAAGRLGLEPGSLRFLGFPDDGLAALWGAYWSQPYTSPRTGAQRPPYADGAPDVEFEGRRLAALIEGELAAFAPTVVIMPDPADTHDDHAHASYFVVEALRTLQSRAVLPGDVMLLSYLVHYPSWPHRAGGWQLPLDGPPDTTWRNHDLSAAALAAKRAAIAEYGSQLAVMRGFLESFLCQNELLGEVEPRILDRIASVH